ncbi:hypothetical protein CP8484711_0924B, partial [Chlamydia psittaci 84-8471/1]
LHDVFLRLSEIHHDLMWSSVFLF